LTAQQHLFEAESPPRDEPCRLFAEVIFNRPLDQPYSYGVPAQLEDLLQPGQRVLVPLGRGNKSAVGYCVGVSETPPERAVKSILRVLDEQPLLTPALLKLTRWMAGYYLCSWGHVLNAIVPAGARDRAGTRERVFLQAVPRDELPKKQPKLSPRQTQAIELLRQEPRPIEARELARRLGCGVAVLLGLVKKGSARRLLQRVEQPLPPTGMPPTEEPLRLNADQQLVHAALSDAQTSGGFKPFLLHGVTGSGKTEIYLQAIEQCVNQGKEALVLVPEISLTPQTIRRFRGRFPHVAVLHSHLSDVERGSYWRQIAAGQVQVVVGARSAVFAPTRRLGLIVVDEEHEGSFKQETTPRYQARDVAVVRAQMEGIPIVLGSATPSLESWHNAQRGQYQLLSLPKRVLQRPLPNVHLIDLRHEPVSRGRLRAISPSLERAMRSALDAGGQVILFLNRRGFSTYLCCPSCGQVVKCRFCEVTLTHHKDRDVLLCHYCGYEQTPPERCAECGLSQIKYLGQGTEKLEAEIAQKFPDVPALRMDSDSMRRPGSHARAFEAFRKGDVKILLGTQMIAKGLDFPNVTLVGVVNADIALHLPDFRSAERTFQLLAQVAGRTGRGERGGKVLVQTFNPEHPCIHLAARHDFVAFAAAELSQRKEHAYPPFSRMARVILRGKDQETVEGHANHLAEAFRRALPLPGDPPPVVRLLGPAEAPLFRLKGYYRYHFQVQSNSSAALHELLRSVLAQVKSPKAVEVVVDVDPWNLL
jgi:primosomal protein N' (replication factor Y)